MKRIKENRTENQANFYFLNSIFHVRNCTVVCISHLYSPCTPGFTSLNPCVQHTHTHTHTHTQLRERERQRERERERQTERERERERERKEGH